MRTSRRIPAYRDGYVRFIQPLSSNVSSFGAPRNVRSEDDAELVVELAYDRMTHRQRDMEFAYSIDRTLDLKLRCPYHENVTSKLQAIIGESLYDVYEVDPDINNMQMYVYLQENRKL